jgi:alpha-ribazole phosphatase
MVNSKTIYFIRHGDIGEEYRGKYIGSSNVELSKAGIIESSNIGIYLQKINIERVLASPLLRVQQTVKTALPNFNNVEYCESLSEINFGLWEKKSFDEIYREYPEEVAKWDEMNDSFTFPFGERLSDFRSRVSATVTKLKEMNEHSIVIFSHGGIITNLICQIIGLPLTKALAFRVDRGSISSAELFSNGLGVLTGLNYKPCNKGNINHG